LHPKLKVLLQYTVMIGITATLLWLSLRGLTVAEGEDKSEFIWNAWRRCDKGYLLIMALVAMASHLLRAVRWKMMLQPSGNNVKLSNSFLSLMIGYLVNMAVPRGGEVSRCYNLYKLEETPVEVSFGTVVVERLVDLACLIILIGLSFIVEWQRLKAFIDTLDFSSSGKSSFPIWIVIVIVVVIILAVGVYMLRKNEKLRKILIGFKVGFLSIFRLKNKWLFVFYSFGIWALYFLMSYFVVIAFPETRDLGMSAVLTLFAIGSIAMAAPLPGGAGSYHTLVPLGLVMLYNLRKSDAVAFVFIFHGWQTIIMIIAGVVSLIVSYLIIRWKKVPVK